MLGIWDASPTFLTLGCILNLPGHFKIYYCLGPSPGGSGLIDVECDLDVKILKASPSDSRDHCFWSFALLVKNEVMENIFGLSRNSLGEDRRAITLNFISAI